MSDVDDAPPDRGTARTRPAPSLPSVYPPDDHVLRDLPFEMEETGPRSAVSRLRLTPNHCHHGRVDPATLLVLTDVVGLYRDFGKSNDVIQEINPEDLAALLPTLDAGMVPKMTACHEAVVGGVPRATVVDGRDEHAVLLEIFTDEGVGTQVLPGVPMKVRSHE